MLTTSSSCHAWGNSFTVLSCTRQNLLQPLVANILNSFTIWHPMYKCQLVLKSSACPHLLVQLIDSWTGWVYIILLGHLSGFSLYTCLGASPTDPISSMRSCKEWLIFLVFFSHSNNAALSSSFSCVKCFIFFFNRGWRYFNLHYSHVAGETLVTNKWYLFCR